jgi:Amt family ammonium transporter
MNGIHRAGAWGWLRTSTLSFFLVTGFYLTAYGQEAGELKVMADTAWTLIAAFLVFWMNAGFGCVESGFCRAKNAVNILGKNFVVFGISSLAFWLVGWGIMFGDGNGFMGTCGWLISGADNSPATGDAYQGVFKALNWTGIPLLAKFFFQLVFAGTAATIVSGCVAERIHYHSFMIFSFLLVAVSYPITGHWIWGGGWLAAGETPADPHFFDFAGSTVVHSVGGWAGLAGIILLGPRLGKFGEDGAVHPIPGHSMALAFLGGLILWLGWFGFNPGSTMAAAPNDISHIVVTTNLACAVGLLAATTTAWVAQGRPDFSMTVNGALAGLVAITAPCAWVTPVGAAVIGLVAGVLVVFAVIFFDKLRIDDPVGALSVHLVNGIWGTIAVGLFATEEGIPTPGPKAGLFYDGGVVQLIEQLKGIAAVGGFTFIFSLVVWGLLRAVTGIRVAREDEIAGLDVSEMGMRAYPEEPALTLE